MDDVNLALSLVLPLEMSEQGKPPNADLLRRGVLRAVKERFGGSIADALHTARGEGGHPYTVSDPFRYRDGWSFRTTALGQDTCRVLSAALQPGSRLVPDSMQIAVAREARAAVLTAGSLSQLAEPARVLRLHLAKPTALAAAHGGDYDPLPRPESLLGSWWRRWRTHVGLEYLPHSWGDDRQAVRTWALQGLAVRGGKVNIALVTALGRRRTSLPACSGHLDIRCEDPDSPAGRSFALLARAALFSGTGQHVGFGMGQTVATGTEVPGSAVGLPWLAERHPLVA